MEHATRYSQVPRIESLVEAVIDVLDELRGLRPLPAMFQEGGKAACGTQLPGKFACILCPFQSRAKHGFAAQVAELARTKAIRLQANDFCRAPKAA